MDGAAGSGAGQPRRTASIGGSAAQGRALLVTSPSSASTASSIFASTGSPQGRSGQAPAEPPAGRPGAALSRLKRATQLTVVGIRATRRLDPLGVVVVPGRVKPIALRDYYLMGRAKAVTSK
jgi:hypothetical protein